MHKSFLRRSMNRILHLFAQLAPGATTFRPFLHKLRGVKIHGTVFIGDQVYIENEFPEVVELHDGVRLATRAIIFGHFHGTGRVIIETNARVGINCVIAAPVGRTITIGESSVIAPLSVVTKNVPPFMFVGGSPAKPIAKIDTPITMESSYEEFKGGLKPL